MRNLLFVLILLGLAVTVPGSARAECRLPEALPDGQDFLPSELAVSPDGKMVYATTTSHDYVYRLEAGRLPDIMAFYGEPLADCKPGKDLATDAPGHLLFTNRQDQFLYRLIPDQLQALYRERRTAQYFTMPTPYEPAKHAGFGPARGLQREGDWLYFQVSAPGEYIIRRINLQSFETEDLLHRVEHSGAPVPSPLNAPFTIKAEHVYCLQLEGSQLRLMRYLLQSKDSGLPETLPLDVPDAARAKLPGPVDLLSGPDNLIYFSDNRSHSVWQIRLGAAGGGAELRLLAGCGQTGFRDGKGREACFSWPAALSLDTAGNLYVADTGNHAIRKIRPDGQVTTFYKAR